MPFAIFVRAITQCSPVIIAHNELSKALQAMADNVSWNLGYILNWTEICFSELKSILHLLQRYE